MQFVCTRAKVAARYFLQTLSSMASMFGTIGEEHTHWFCFCQLKEKVYSQTA